MPEETQVGVSRRGALFTAVGAGAALWLGAGHNAAARTLSSEPGAYAIEDFFNHRGTKGAALSPSGEKFAVLEQFGEGDQTRSQLVVRNANDPEGAAAISIEVGALAVRWVHWTSEDRLLVKTVMEPKVQRIRMTGSNRSTHVEGYPTERVVAVHTVTGQMAVMFQNEINRLRASPYLGQVSDFLPNDPDHVLMPAYESDGSLGLYKMNVISGVGERIERGPSSTMGWVMHDGIPVLRRNINARGNVETWFARLPGEADWRLMRRNRLRDAPEFAYVGQTQNPETVRVLIRADSDNHLTVRDINLRDFSVSAPINHREGVDAIDGIYDSRGKYIGVAYYGERLEYEFEDPALSAHHRALNQFFENDCDVKLVDISADGNRMIGRVSGPREPGTWIFYDRAARNILPLGSATSLSFEKLGEGQRIIVDTRDGAKIEAYLTAPLSGKAGPLVVLPHGGPEVRDYRSYDRQVQILAAQGWWVLQPNFRGSGGYGKAFAEAGWGRWGERMQEDVEDAIAQVIRDKGLDANRVAIMGTSYGGYAALMGAVRRPELYKAAISICGVADLVDMLDWEKRTDDTPGNMIFEFWTKRIGDLSTQRPMIEAASPRRRVSEIVCPVLLVHGVKDEIVPPIQSQAMHRALRGAGKSVQYVEINGGHGDWDDKEELAMMKSCVQLLNRAFA